MIDIHCHLIPGVDDGPRTMDESIALCEACVDDGITHAICTPHILPGRYENTTDTLREPFDNLNNQLIKRNIPLAVSLSAEVRIDFQVFDLLANNMIPLMFSNQLLASNKKFILIELPDAKIPMGSEKFFQNLIDNNIHPIIAHPERNKEIMHDPTVLAPFLKMGCKLQITASSLVGQFGELVETIAWAMIESKTVIAIASDCHNLKGRRPKMSIARTKVASRFGTKIADYLTLIAPSQLYKH